MRRAHERMAGTALLLLQHEIRATMGNGLTDDFSLVADDGKNPIGRHHLPRCFNHVRQQWPSAYRMQDFGMFGSQSCALARGQNCDGKIFQLAGRWQRNIFRFPGH